jgi:hypothetical protein
MQSVQNDNFTVKTLPTDFDRQQGFGVAIPPLLRLK